MKIFKEELNISTVDDCTVVTTANGDIAIMNETASYMIETLCKEQSIEDSIAEIANHYKTEANIIKYDIDNLLAELAAYSFLVD